MNPTWINKYRIDLLQTPLRLNIKPISNFVLMFEALPQFNFFKNINGRDEISKIAFDLYSIEFIPKIAYTFANLNINLGFRIFQWKKIDPIYRYGCNFLAANPGYLDQTFDSYNPTKIILGVGYQLK